MKIVSLSVSNIMKVSAAEIVPKSEVVVIQGENEAGKSTLLNSIVMAFSGDRALPELPLKKGSKRGEIVVKMDGDKTLGIPAFTITRSITDKKAYVKIEPESVTAGETPRSFLDKLIGSISFDPLKFINEESKKQRSTVLKLIGIDPDEWAAKEKVAFDKRTEIGRELKIAEAKVRDRVVYDDVEETEEIKLGDLTTKLQKVMADNQTLANRKETNERLKADALKIKNEEIPAQEVKIANLELALVAARAELSNMNTKLADKRKQYNTEKDDLALSFPSDVGSINKEIEEIESKNAKIRHNQQVAIDIGIKNAKQGLYDLADQEVECIRAERLKLIQEAIMPISGLTIDDDGILYNDIPLDQCSDGAKLMIGVAVSMALNPKLRVIQIKDGSLLGPKNMELLRKVVKDNDFQLWIERVSDLEQYNATGKVGIFIEEGQVILDSGEPVKQKCDQKSKKSNTAPVANNQKDEDW